MKIEKKATTMLNANTAAVVDAMEPDRLYRVSELAKLTGIKPTHVQQALGLAVLRGLLTLQPGNRNGYIRPMAIATVTQLPFSRWGELKGYDTQMSQFRALCEATRKHS